MCLKILVGKSLPQTRIGSGIDLVSLQCLIKSSDGFVEVLGAVTLLIPEGVRL